MGAWRVNPYAARTAYIRFQASFRPNKMPLESVIGFVIDAQLTKELKFCRIPFLITIDTFFVI